MEAKYTQEIPQKASPGLPKLILFILLLLLTAALIIIGGITLENSGGGSALGLVLLIAGIAYLAVGWVPMLGLKIVKPQEALVLTLFGKYTGTLRHEGFYFVHPFSSAVNPTAGGAAMASSQEEQHTHALAGKESTAALLAALNKKSISLKAMTLNNNKQKINDKMGNPVEIGIVVIWRVVNTAMAAFNVDNYKTYLSIQCDSALRNIARLYPYDVAEDDDEMTLRGSSQEVAQKLREEIQRRVANAGLEIMEARITHLAYAPEIAAAMLQRQQASAIIDARKMIVDGAVGMVEMALDKLSERDIVELDEERKAAMVSNLLVVLCGNKDAQPIVNSGTLY